MTVYIVGEALPNDETYIVGVFDNLGEAMRLRAELTEFGLNRNMMGMVYGIQTHEVFSTRKEFSNYQKLISLTQDPDSEDE